MARIKDVNKNICLQLPSFLGPIDTNYFWAMTICQQWTLFYFGVPYCQRTHIRLLLKQIFRLKNKQFHFQMITIKKNLRPIDSLSFWGLFKTLFWILQTKYSHVGDVFLTCKIYKFSFYGQHFRKAKLKIVVWLIFAYSV